jgi:hypothetical protein
MNYLFHWIKWEVFTRVVGGVGNVPRRIWGLVRNGQRHTTARTRLGIKFEHPYRVRSGDPDTSLGNTVCTDFIAFVTDKLFAEYRSQGMDLAETAVAITERLKHDLGYVLELKLTRDVSDVTFLSGLFLPVNGQTWWCPKPGRLIAGLGWTLKRPGNVSRHRDLAGTLNSFRAYNYVPFVGVYLRAVMSLVPERYRLTEPIDLHRQVHVDDCFPEEAASDTWDFFTARYGLGRADEAAFAQSLAAATSIPFMIESPAFEILMQVDAGW